MSKTLGNVVDPVDVIETHGTDALRFTLATGTHCSICSQSQILHFKYIAKADLLAINNRVDLK